MKTKIFFDTEFTGLHKNTTLVSLGMVAETGQTFYAEFNDYDKSQVTPWIQEKVINKLKWNDRKRCLCFGFGGQWRVKNNKKGIKEDLEIWLSQFEEYELWNDCLAYDWVLLAELLGEIEGVNPDDNYYYSHSLCSLDTIMGITDEDYKIMRNPDEGKGHNSLYDAIKIKECFDKTMTSMRMGE